MKNNNNSFIKLTKKDIETVLGGTNTNLSKKKTPHKATIKISEWSNNGFPSEFYEEFDISTEYCEDCKAWTEHWTDKNGVRYCGNV